MGLIQDVIPSSPKSLLKGTDAFLTQTAGHSRAGLQHRDIHANDLPGLHKIDGRGDLCRGSPQRQPVIRRQDDKSQLTAREILLMRDTLIAGEQHIEPRLLGGLKQRAVLQPLLSQFIRAHYLMSSQEPGEWGWRVGIKKDLHATAAGCSRELLAKART